MSSDIMCFPLLAQFTKSCRARSLSNETIRWYEGILTDFCTIYGQLPLDVDSIEDFIAHQECGDERRHGYYRAIRRFYRWLEKRYGTFNPVALMDPPKRQHKEPHFLMPEDIQRLLNYQHAPKMKAALLFLVDTGARLGELAALNVDCLEETPWGFVARIKGKTGTRLVPISYDTYHQLMVNLPFPWTKHHLGILISRACKAAGVKATAHTLRHTFGTLWEGDEDILRRIMGHRHFSTTERYRHLRVEYLARQHAKYSPLRMVQQTKSML